MGRCRKRRRITCAGNGSSKNGGKAFTLLEFLWFELIYVDALVSEHVSSFNCSNNLIYPTSHESRVSPYFFEPNNVGYGLAKRAFSLLELTFLMEQLWIIIKKVLMQLIFIY